MTRSSENPLRIVFVGHVDHGKSTLVGRLFHDTGSLPEGKLEQIQATCQRRGVPFEWAFLMDALQAERDQNITIDTSQIWFRTERRPYVIIDAPGHREFLKNMITGAASADAAFLLIAANEGVREQSRRHGYLLSLLGIEQVVVLVNKMDMEDYSQEVFDAIESEYREFLGQIGLNPIRFIPVSAREGDNVASQATETMPWYDGPSVVEALDGFALPRFSTDLPLRFPLQDVYRFDERRILAGRIESGTLQVGDEIVFQPEGKRGVVQSIERWSAPSQDVAQAGESVGVTLTEQIFVERGHVGASEDTQPVVTNRFRANVFWMGRRQLTRNEPYKLKLATQEVECRVVDFERVIDASSLEIVDRDNGKLERDDVAEVVIETKRPIALDVHNKIAALGRFVIVDGFDLAGGGIVTEGLEATQKQEGKSFRTRAVSSTERFSRNGHNGMVVWLGAHPERDAVAAALERQLFNRGLQTFLLNDEVLQGTEEVAPVAAALALAGVVVVADVNRDAPASDIRAALDETTAQYVGVSLAGESPGARFWVDVDGQGFDQAMNALVEQLLPLIHETWAVEGSR